MRLEEACIPAFARHETFAPRYGWLKKAYDGARCDNGIFTRDGATVELGVGKNMVRSIRFWGHAARVLAEVENPSNSRATLSAPSRIGQAIFDDQGWDPYCEDPATLWLIHWLLLAPPSQLPVWWAVFHEFTALEFTDAGVTQFAEDHIGSLHRWNTPHSSSIAKDVSCLLRTYAHSAGSARAGADDLIDCPMRDLGLLVPATTGTRTYRFAVGAKPTLPPEIVLYASLDFLSRSDEGAQTATVSRLSTEPGGPGRAFRLPEMALASALEDAASRTADVNIVAPAGVPQLAFVGDAASLATDVLNRYYAGRRAGVAEAEVAAGWAADRPAPNLLATAGLRGTR